MLVQNIIFPNDVCDDVGLYFRTNQNVEIGNNEISIRGKESVSTYTYMNLFDVSFWKKHTGIMQWAAKIQVQGIGVIKLYKKNLKEHTVIASLSVSSNDFREYIFDFSCEDENEIVYFEFVTDKQMTIKDGCFFVKDQPLCRDVHISVVICTYRRNQELQDILSTLKASDFFEEKSSLYGKMTVRVVDNAAEVRNDTHPFVTIFHNQNTGGAGGFTRGIIETRKDEKKYGITNVVLMDDDVKIIPETFYRLYAILSMIHEEYQQEVIAGRMFRLDDKKVQYTAAEIWNRGEIRHIGFQKNMCDRESLNDINDSKEAEYSGWWFACFPMCFIRKNTPLPLFLHCDDVEYGLRHGGTPIILNGIQVWHETFEYRQNHWILYYDTRNTLIVNSIYNGANQCRSVLISDFKNRISKEHVKGNYLNEYIIIKAFGDFVRKKKYKNDSAVIKEFEKIRSYKSGNRILNAILWRITIIKIILYCFIKEKRNE